MASLKDKSKNILNEKQLNLLPENIKKDVSILGVIGTLESGGSSDYNAKLVAINNGNIRDYITEISENLDTSNITLMASLFSSCKNLTTIPLLDTSKVTTMSSMFYYCTSLSTIPQLDTRNVTVMASMFFGCKNLITIPQLDTSNVTNMASMFFDCTNLTTIPLLNTSSVTAIQNMCKNCTSLSDGSLNNILAMCTNATSYAGTKTLKYIGLTGEQAAKCTTLSNYEAFTSAGWTTGY